MSDQIQVGRVMAMREQRVLAAIRAGAATSSEIAEKLGDSRRLIGVYLVGMAARGLVQRGPHLEGTSQILWRVGPKAAPEGAQRSAPAEGSPFVRALLEEEVRLQDRLGALQTLIGLYGGATDPGIEPGRSDAFCVGAEIAETGAEKPENPKNTGPVKVVPKPSRDALAELAALAAANERVEAPTAPAGLEVEPAPRAVGAQSTPEPLDTRAKAAPALPTPPVEAAKLTVEAGKPQVSPGSPSPRKLSKVEEQLVRAGVVARPDAGSIPPAVLSTPPAAPKPLTPSPAAVALAGAARAMQAPKAALKPVRTPVEAASTLREIADTRRPFDPYSAFRSAEASRGVTSYRPDPPAEQRGAVNNTSELMGDPPPGRSALDQRRAAQ